ncbi:MAG: MoxR family ATPase [Leptospiraceae bacterium]|nr:MoxR family ATPase [Leptospiraceae bacterium]
MSQEPLNIQDGYVLSRELEEAVLTAEITGRPLLVKGEPGTGKTLLAEHISLKKKRPLFQWHVKSTSLAKEGLYFYDAVSRLNDSRFPDEETGRNVHNIEDYIRLGPLGEAFTLEKTCIVLIDEIDKADIEFPNDLLLVLDRMRFVITETGKVVEAKIRPLFIITSNNEKELPDAFLRRCIFHFIEFPDKKMMEEIILAHFPDIQHSLLNTCISTFYKLRQISDLRKKPSTSELLDWIHVLLYQGADLRGMQRIPYIGTLIKNEEDLMNFASLFHVVANERN